MALATRQRALRTSPLSTLTIAGRNNDMADIASRSFGNNNTTTYHLSDLEFLTNFSSTFLLPQGQSWQLFRVSSKLRQLVSSEIRSELCTPASWRQITKNGGSIGTIGASSPPTIKWTPISKQRQLNETSSSSSLLLNGSGQVLTVEAKESVLKPFKLASEQLARPSQWTDTTTPSTPAKINI